MTQKSYQNYGKRSQQTPQTEPLPGSTQVPNNAGGYSWVVGPMQQLLRFLILGTSGGTFYVGERKLTRNNLLVLEELLRTDHGDEVLALIISVSESGRAMSNDPCLFALARCMACDVHPKVPQRVRHYKGIWHQENHRDLFERIPDGGTLTIDNKTFIRDGSILHVTMARDERTVQVIHPNDIAVRQLACEALPRVARTGTHLFHFMEYVKQFRGDGPVLLRAVKNWYNSKPSEALAYQLIKYRQRDGWSHKNALQVAHPKPATPQHAALYHWAINGWPTTPTDVVPADKELRQIWAFERAKIATSAQEVATLISEYDLTREAVPTSFLTDPGIWVALLKRMPMEAMLRNLANMTRYGVLSTNIDLTLRLEEILAPIPDAITSYVVERLTDQQAIRRSKLHPIKILSALLTYEQGKGVRGQETWKPIQAIVDALNTAFYLSFKNAEPTGKRILLAIDTSGSMSGSINGMPHLSCRRGATAMALIYASIEPHCHIIGFETRTQELPIVPTQRLDEAVHMVEQLTNPAGTNCALPFTYAREKRMDFDAIISFTDSETWAGNTHVSQALEAYRTYAKHPVYAVNVQMAANRVSNFSPDDLLALECVGFDTNVPTIISNFLRGEF